MTYSLNKFLLSPSSVPDVVLGAKGVTGNKTKSLLLWSFCFNARDSGNKQGTFLGCYRRNSQEAGCCGGLNERECGRDGG